MDKIKKEISSGIYISVFMIIGLLVPGNLITAQTGNDSETGFFRGSISATNNGISLIPSFNLGKPAVAFSMSAGKGKFSFDPQLRFAMEGKPWSFIFWGRYKIVDNENFSMRVGAHPALSFKDIEVIMDGEPMEIMRVRRFLAAELAPGFKVAKNITLSPYYLFAYGVESDIRSKTHYVALQSSFSDIGLGEKYYLNLSPQVYYLRMDQLEGYYFSSGFSFLKRDFPLSVSSMVNKTIKSEIASKDFIWNVSLVYSFGN